MSQSSASRTLTSRTVQRRLESQTDPTQTKTLRNRYSAEVYRRFRALKGVIRKTIVNRDAFGIKSRKTSLQSGDFTGNAPDDMVPGDGFRFPTDPDKLEAFMEWLDEQEQRGILETTRDVRGVTGASSPWMNTYLRASYKKGLRHADHAAYKLGLVDSKADITQIFNAPRHVETVGMTYTRAYRELDGVTRAMDQAISRELSQGLVSGDNPREIARNLNASVDDIGVTRGRLIARTETIRSFNQAALNRYEQLGINEVEAKVEFRTAQDSRVCAECQSLGGRTFTTDEAKGIIPVHPACRCTWLPKRPSSS